MSLFSKLIILLSLIAAGTFAFLHPDRSVGVEDGFQIPIIIVTLYAAPILILLNQRRPP